MSLFNWLRGLGRNKTPEAEPVEHTTPPEPRKFAPVPKWTHAGKRGKTVHCPLCSGETHVYHFGWSALLCQSCKSIIDKGEWLMPVKEDK